MPLLMHSTRKLCLEPTSHLGRILAIGVAELPGEIRLFTGNDPIAEHHPCGHNEEQYPRGENLPQDRAVVLWLTCCKNCVICGKTRSLRMFAWA